jgi:hypothetical protein
MQEMENKHQYKSFFRDADADAPFFRGSLFFLPLGRWKDSVRSSFSLKMLLESPPSPVA